jgi:hypothetical protein
MHRLLAAAAVAAVRVIGTQPADVLAAALPPVEE